MKLTKYDKFDDKIYNAIYKLCKGKNIEVTSTGTVNPAYYAGHKKLGLSAGLSLTIRFKNKSKEKE